MSCDDVRELLEGYALGALEPEELARVEAHLSTCADCRAVAAAYGESLARLPEALTLASPLRLPPKLKDRLLRAIETGAADARDEAPPAALPRNRRYLRVRRLLVVVGAMALAGALTATAALSLALDRERELTQRFAGLLDQREVVLEVVDGRETERAFLRATDETSRSYGKLFTNSELRDVVVMAGRLPKPSAGTTYRVWLSRDHEMTSPGVLKVNDKGFGLLVFKAKRPGLRYDAARVVLQPAGSATPGAALVLTWTRDR
jgi:anti-sigma-K factor RskA